MVGNIGAIVMCGLLLAYCWGIGTMLSNPFVEVATVVAGQLGK